MFRIKEGIGSSGNSTPSYIQKNSAGTFAEDFINIAGFVAEKIHTGRKNLIGARSDFRNWFDTTLIDLPEQLSLKYQRFIFEYTMEVLQLTMNWDRITAIAEALIVSETLTYNEVWNVIREKFGLKIN